MTTRLMGLAALLAAATMATAASAATTTSNPFAQDKAVLQLSDLDLATPQGQHRLAIRMDQAARAVCGEKMASVHLALEDQARACRAEVLADIRSKIEARSALADKPSAVRLASNR
ncbi:UrcA family protein [Novosphingobium terrae]|uniref:UrcA family protein n=1 Tax=Novosphingobium terrae TaxID=2726189 RepID=UPI00197E1FEA|nr:UrcA family protein [Novosphingobium terrae]